METSSFPLIRTKLHVPNRRTGLVSRPRLFALLDERPTAQFILVTAPAGFGKSTLVLDWLHHANVKAAWLSLDERDDDTTRFLIYLIAAIQTQLPDFGWELLASMQQPISPDSQIAMDALLSELSATSAEFALVLDDYHVLHNGEIQQCMAMLIDYLPPHLRLAILSRVEPDLPLSKWRGRGQMVELGTADLQFNLLETQDFLRKTMGLELADRAIADIEQRTEGWIAGLQLAALSVRGASDQATAIQSVTGGDRHVADYLINEVMAQQPVRLQRFLEHTSILDEFNSSLCDHLMETDNSAHFLQRIDRENLFLIALDNQREWYRYHHLFAGLLRNRLYRSEGKSGVARLHRRAAAWYAEQDQVDAAVHHALAGGDAENAARLVGQTPLEALWQAGGLGTVLNWVADLPEPALKTHPRAAIVAAIACLLVGDIAESDRYVALTAESRDLAGERKLIHAIFARNEGKVSEALDLLQSADREIGPDQWLLKVIAQFQIAIAHLENGDLSQAAMLLHEIKRRMRVETQAGLTMMLQAAAFECMVATLQGDPDSAKRIGIEAIVAAQVSPHIVPIVGQIHAALGTIAYHQNNLVAAQESLDQALYWGERTGITDILFNAYETQIKLHCVRGEREEALTKLHRIRQLYQSSGFPEIINYGRAEEAAIHLRLGNLARALRWANEAGFHLEDPIAPRSRSIYHILASVHLANARISRNRRSLDELLGLTMRLIEQSEARGQVLPHISALLLQAQVLALQEQTTEAKQQLLKAISLAEPGRFVRVFLDGGPPLLDLLRPLADDQPGDAFLAGMVRAFERDASLSDSLVEPLTDREREILGLIAVGLTNKEIEQRLVISHNTVRTHIKNLYSKLAVSSRTQAVRRGQELGLIWVK
jgi:LuxR family maltose regulon positive regulatory protein